MLPVAGIILGAIGLLVGGYAAINTYKINKTLAGYDEKLSSIETNVDSRVNAATQTAAQAEKYAKALERSTNDAFGQIGPIIGNLQAAVAKLEEAGHKAPAPSSGGSKKSETVVAAADEYIVKSGDSGVKIARNNNVSWSDLQAVNPGVNWNKLAIGQKVKLPKK